MFAVERFDFLVLFYNRILNFLSNSTKLTKQTNRLPLKKNLFGLFTILRAWNR